MNREQLHALLTQAKAIVHHTDFVIVGSLSILGAVSDPPRTMVMSIDVDTYLKNDPQRTYELAQALGQGSVFEDEFGYYLDPVSPSLPSFPEGWQERLIPLDFGDVTVTGKIGARASGFLKFIASSAYLASISSPFNY